MVQKMLFFFCSLTEDLKKESTFRKVYGCGGIDGAKHFYIYFSYKKKKKKNEISGSQTSYLDLPRKYISKMWSKKFLFFCCRKIQRKYFHKSIGVFWF